MRNLKITIEYNGAHYSGWQKQSGQKTIQEEIENAFLTLTGEKVVVEGSGRTDKGVHALAQVASVSLNSKIPCKNLAYALNNLLPNDVRIKKVENAKDDFHARFSSKRKTYRYVAQVGGQISAIENELVGFYPYPVDEALTREAIKKFVGKHNFKAFCSANTQVTNFEREIFDFSLSRKGRKLVFEVTGNGFLYNMVRILVGTALDVGSKKLPLENIEKAFKTGERKLTGKTMPPNGLYLKKVQYEN